jgi:lysophospholipid acyltransferase
MGIFAAFGGQASFHRILTPAWDNWGWATRFAFIQFAGLVARTKYYGVWSFTEVS